MDKIINFLIKYNSITKDKIPGLIKQTNKVLEINISIDNFKITKSFIDFNILSSHIEKIRMNLKSKYKNNVLVENKINHFFGLFMKKQDQLENIDFEQLLETSKYHYYIKFDKNLNNIRWKYCSIYGNIKMTINMMKPEKTTQDIIDDLKKDKKIPLNQPKCVICIENVGYEWKNGKDSKENLRVKYLYINNSNWFFQYSPYAYVKKHFIINSLKHVPMKFDIDTIKVQLEFVHKNSHFFLGSNAGIPIVGGSLLSHNHFQGGEENLPIFKAKSKNRHDLGKNLKLIELFWPITAFVIEGTDILSLVKYSSKIIELWDSWKFIDKNIKNNKNNSITTITKKEGDKFRVFFILRNNSVSKKYPEGIFHIKNDKHNIKKENIGLMEAAGLSILPKRLSSEMQKIINFHNNSDINMIKNNVDTKKHYNFYNSYLCTFNSLNMEIIKKVISKVFIECLKDCDVFVNSRKDFDEFINGILNEDN